MIRSNFSNLLFLNIQVQDMNLALLNDIPNAGNFSSPIDVTLVQLGESLRIESIHLSLKEYLLL